MANRFSDDLLQLDTYQTCWAEVAYKLTGSWNNKFFNYLFLHLRANWIIDRQYLATFICFLAVMSDNDIDELIIDWKDHNHG